MKSDSHLFKIAKEVSLESDYSGSAHIGAIVVYKGAILAKGSNSNKTHTYQDKYNKFRYKNSDGRYLPSKAHAEVASLTKIKFLDIDFSKVDLYVYRELKNGKMAMARPCPSCMAMIKEMGIKNIHYTTPDGFAYEKLTI